MDGRQAELGPEFQEVLRDLNHRLVRVQVQLAEMSAKMRKELDARVLDPSETILDFELEAQISLHLREEDPEWTDEDDCILGMREFSLKESDLLLDVGKDWSCDRQALAFLRPVCWLFHDFHEHNYSSRRRRDACKAAKSLKELARVGRIWVDLNVIHQWYL